MSGKASILKRFFFVLGIGISSSILVIASDDDPKLIQFANDYAQAVKAKDVSKIKTFFDPDLFLNLSDEDKRTTLRWFGSFQPSAPAMLSPGDPVWVHVKILSANPSGDWNMESCPAI